MASTKTWVLRAALPLEAVAVLLALRWSLGTSYHVPAARGTVPVATISGIVPHGIQARPAAAVPITALRLRAVPLRLHLSDLAVDAAIVPVTTDGRGALGVPTDVRQVGWWKNGAVPGSPQGTVVLDGHVDSASQGRGALYDLSHALPGSTVIVDSSAGEVRYRVVARRAYRKADLPAETFARTGRPRLVLITCGGPFSSTTHHYEDNVVIYAAPVTP